MGFTPEQLAKSAETRRRKAEERRKAMEAAGIPESPVLRSQREPDPEKQAWIQKMRACHMNGRPLADESEEALVHLRYEWTDEWRAEYNVGKAEPSGITLGADEFTKKLEHRRDAVVEQGMEPWEAPDPMKEVADAHARPGYAQRFLSPAKCDKDGLRGFELVRDKNGSPVKARNMMLAEMPLSKREQRQKFYRDKADQAINQIENAYKREGGETATGDITQR